MKKRPSDTPSTNYEEYALKMQIEALEKRNHALEVENGRLLKDIERLTNLSIPSVSKELARSIRRSVKFRATRAIWGSERFYQANKELIGLVGQQIDKSNIGEVLRVVRENDAENLAHLSRDPSPRRVFVYETVRKLSHAPRRAKKVIKRKTT